MNPLKTFGLTAIITWMQICTIWASSNEKLDPAETFSNLENYYNEHALSFIKVDDPSSENPLDWFRTDVDQFIENENKSDFISAKRRSYAAYNFETKTQLHKVPYYTLEAWGVLNHPPIRELSSDHSKIFSDFESLDYSKIESRLFDPEFHSSVDEQTQTRLTYGNQLQFLPNGDSYREKLRIIAEAKKYLFVTVMHFQCDESSMELVKAMGERKKAGVDVRVILEAVHDVLGNTKCKREMRDRGIEVLDFTDAVKTLLKTGVNHSKFWIRDGEEAILGGQNIHNGSNLSTGFNFRTRDSDVLIRRGPAVTDLMSVFVDVWDKHKTSRHSGIGKYKKIVANLGNDESERKVRGRENYRAWLSDPESRMNGVCRVVSQRGGADPINVAEVYMMYVEASSRHLMAESPSIKFDVKKVHENKRNELLVNLIRTKAESDGFKVDLLTNGIGGRMGDLSDVIDDLEEKTDSKFLDSILNWFDHLLSIGKIKSARKTLKELEEGPNVRVHQYFNYIHSKMWMFDRIAPSIGSWNIDTFSAEKNYETVMICQDTSLAKDVEAQLIKDFANSVPIVSKNGK